MRNTRGEMDRQLNRAPLGARFALLVGTAAGFLAGLLLDVMGQPESWTLTAIGAGIGGGALAALIVWRRGLRRPSTSSQTEGSAGTSTPRTPPPE